ncbi:hypothetical protein GNI_113260 [Gregarina niphandrodes]|uniref:Uncharacterized protein n=1 Tax=Gregarina niphandrodes TaxID=110365 RepID=A0A023B3D4_GRENI|nr:hypothetical protein GNI_113260 [Gregarina niphandrodes]EZG55427.1 hypothetical protein GNI_113260 [Gregarina niphandrodes]|eukprot:XP_011131567.1 hypothetical protein GNI_113260 [Gregarina niphandrodes]
MGRDSLSAKQTTTVKAAAADSGLEGIRAVEASRTPEVLKISQHPHIDDPEDLTELISKGGVNALFGGSQASAEPAASQGANNQKANNQKANNQKANNQKANNQKANSQTTESKDPAAAAAKGALKAPSEQGIRSRSPGPISAGVSDISFSNDEASVSPSVTPTSLLAESPSPSMSSVSSRADFDPYRDDESEAESQMTPITSLSDASSVVGEPDEYYILPTEDYFHRAPSPAVARLHEVKIPAEYYFTPASPAAPAAPAVPPMRAYNKHLAPRTAAATNEPVAQDEPSTADHSATTEAEATEDVKEEAVKDQAVKDQAVKDQAAPEEESMAGAEQGTPKVGEEGEEGEEGDEPVDTKAKGSGEPSLTVVLQGYASLYRDMQRKRQQLRHAEECLALAEATAAEEAKRLDAFEQYVHDVEKRAEPYRKFLSFFGWA